MRGSNYLLRGVPRSSRYLCSAPDNHDALYASLLKRAKALMEKFTNRSLEVSVCAISNTAITVTIDSDFCAVLLCPEGTLVN